MNWHGCHARSSADQYRYISSTDKNKYAFLHTENPQVLTQNICLVVHFRCAICPATLLANTKMQYLLKNIHHLKWIKKLWWYCGRQVCPHVRKISLWARGMTVFLLCQASLSSHSKDNLPVHFSIMDSERTGFSTQNCGLCLQWAVIEVPKTFFLVIVLFYLFLCFCICHGNEESIFLTDTTGFEEGLSGLLFSSCCNFQRGLDNAFPRGRHNVVPDGIKEERSGPSEGFLARTEP